MNKSDGGCSLYLKRAFKLTLSGACEFRRSQTLIIGSDSKGVAVTSFVGYPQSDKLQIESPSVDADSYLLRVPSHSADSFPSHVVEG